MTMVIIQEGIDAPYHQVNLSDTANEAIRLKFNPSALRDVNILKSLAAGFITYCEELQKTKPEAARELAVAITNMQTASMWSVLGATKGL